jgi:hypothetical protein
MAIPAFEIELDKDGHIFDSRQVDEALAGLAAGEVTDLLVLSHGWNNDMAEARALYAALLAAVERVQAGGRPDLAGRRLAAVEIFWPSKKFADADLIPGGGAAAAGSSELDPASVIAQLEALKSEPVRLGMAEVNPIYEEILSQAQQLVPRLEGSPAAQREFVLLIRSMLSPKDAHPDDGSDNFFTRDPSELLRDLADPVAPPATASGGGAAEVTGGGGGAAGLTDFFSGIMGAAKRLLNFTTYYQMKERAGTVGKTGAAQVLVQLRQRLPDVRFHLAGHSFGGRLVTAAADQAGPSVKTASLTLLQAAYSHNGLGKLFDGKHDGFFRHVVSDGKVSGPILITHTKNDLAVGIAYPLASRIAGQDAADAAGLGDASDPYGGMGRNGAQKTPERVIAELLPVGGDYPRLAGGKVFNLNADAFIGGHSDIAKDEVAYALLSAVAAGGG